MENLDASLAGRATPESIPRLAHSVAEAELMTGLSRATLYRLMAAGRLRWVKVGERRLVPADSLRELCGAGDVGLPVDQLNGKALFMRILRGIYPCKAEAEEEAAAGLAVERILAGALATGPELVELTRAYAAQQEALGNTDTEFVMQPSRFYGSEGWWRGPFPMPGPPARQS